MRRRFISGIGEVITGDDLKAIQHMNENNFSTMGYLAPTVFRPANGVSNWNYYRTMADAVNRYNGMAVTPAGNIPFNGAAASTLGINVDFFAVVPIVGVLPLPYVGVKKYLYGSPQKIPGCVFRFYKTDGSGPYYAVLGTNLSISATVVSNVAPAKVAALDSLHRELQLAKYKYNTLASYLQTLSKRTLSAQEQQIFNSGLLTLNNFERQLAAIPGVNITYSADGKVSGIGIIPVIIWIAVIIVGAILAAYSLEKILGLIQSVKAINAAYDMQKFAEAQKLNVAAAVTAGHITPTQAATLTGSLNADISAAQHNAAAASTPPAGILDNIQKILMIGGGGFLLAKALKII